jgi:Rrf2 family protein
MAGNTRFAVALHALAALAWLGEAQTSEQLARGTVNTNPVVLRRILARLVKAGILEAQPGKQGGFRLARAPRAIDLASVYRAVEGEEDLLAIHANPEVKSCPVSCAIKPVLDDVFREAEAALSRSLAGRRLSDVIDRIPSAGRASGRG